MGSCEASAEVSGAAGQHAILIQSLHESNFTHNFVDSILSCGICYLAFSFASNSFLAAYSGLHHVRITL